MRFARSKSVHFGVALLWLIAATAAAQAPRDTIDVLFVGNSYTYVNNLPGLVRGISEALDGPIVRTAAHTEGGATLRGHLDEGRLPAILAQGPAGGGRWDWVVLQEQSTLGTLYDSKTGELGSPEAFYAAARELVKEIRAAGARPAFYMTWAKQAFPAQSETLSRVYRSIGKELDAPAAAVGEAWAQALRARPDLGLFLSDGSHPNPAGSYLAACVIYAMLTGRSPVGAPREISGTPWDMAGPVASAEPTVLVSLSPADAAFLQRIAREVAGSASKGETRHAAAYNSADLRQPEANMKIHYLEIVTSDVDSVCDAYAAATGVEFGPPDPALGGARTAKLSTGGLLGVRAPMHETEQPVVRPYWLVDDIEAAWAAALAAGGQEAHPPLEIPGHGTFAIYIRGGVHHGLWQL